MLQDVRKIAVFILVCLLTVCASCATVSAQEYSTEYPMIGNSGSPLWLHCEVEGRGEFCVVLDPDINPQSFGFDTMKKGYNLINNTNDTIVGRAYGIDNSTACQVRWPMHYCMTMKLGNDGSYVDAKITAIYGTTLDLIDYTGDRGNDSLSREEERDGYEAAQTIILLVIGLCMLIRPIFKFTYRQRC